MTRAVSPWLVALAVSVFAADAVRSGEPTAKAAVVKALPLLVKGAEGHLAKRTCFACHNQALPLMAFAAARAHGFAVRDDTLKKQADFIAAFLARNRDNYQQLPMEDYSGRL